MKSIQFIIIVLLFAACKQEYVQESAPLPTVKRAKVEQLSVTSEPLPIYASGKIQSLENAKLSFKTGGIVQRIYVEEGDNITKGQVLASLDLSEINAQVRQAQANVDKLSRDLDRFQRLYTDSAATLQSVQDIATGLDVAKANLTIAQFNQTYSKITASASGKILSKMAEPNELVNPGQPIFIISAEAAGMSLDVGLSDREVVKVKLGDPAIITFDAYPGLEAKAVITEIGADSHPRIGTYGVELTIQDFPYELKNGFFAKASILPSSQQAYYKIPMNALVEGDEKLVSVYLPEDNKAVKASVRPIYIGDDFIAVAQKDLPQVNILTEGSAYLREGEEFQEIQ